MSTSGSPTESITVQKTNAPRDHHWANLEGWFLSYYHLVPRANGGFGLSPQELALITIFSRYDFAGNHSVNGHVTLEKLATYMCCSERTIRRLNDSLVLAGFLSIKSGKLGESNTYNFSRLFDACYEVAEKDGWLKRQQDTVSKSNYQLDNVVQLGGQECPTVRTRVSNSKRKDIFKDIKAKESALQPEPIIELPKTPQLPQAEIENSDSPLPSVEEKKKPSPRPKKQEPESIWFTMSLEKAKESGLYTHSKTFDGKDPSQTKPYWNLIAGMIAWNKIGKPWQEYMSLLKGKEIAAFTKQIKNACLAWEEYSDPEDPITVEELEWIVSYWHFQQMDDKQAKERYFPVSGKAVENNISALRARYRLHIKSLASHHREAA